MGKVLGIKFAPLNVPLERRLQTLGALTWNLCLTCLSFGGTILITTLLFTRYYYLSLLYLVWMIYDKDTCRRGGRSSEWLRSLKVWTYYANYFPAKLHKTVDLDPNKNYLLGYHPHGILAVGSFLSFSTRALGFQQLFPGLTVNVAALNINFSIPLLRDFWTLCGAISPDKESLDYVLSKRGNGNVAVVVVGGAAESLDSVPKTMQLTLKNRKGFVKVAIRNGASLLPCICFGENEIFYLQKYPESSSIHTFQQLMKRFVKFTLPVYSGRGVFQYTYGTLPFRRPLNIIVGAPIDTVMNLNPSQEEVDRVHGQYLRSLEDLFNANKGKYALNSSLQIVFK